MNDLIYNRVVKWNRERYSRQYNAELFNDMLYEEYTEYLEADTLVDQLDGLADLFFISVGALWKLKADPYHYLYEERPTALIYPNIDIDKDKTNVKELERVINKIFEAIDEHILKHLIAYLLELLFREFHVIDCVRVEAELAIHIICDSNDTKDIRRLGSYDKGALKGATYTPPTKRLKLLARSIESA